MEELRYQLDLLKAMNQKLSGRDKMFRLVCDTTNDAFLYYSFDKSEVVTLGNWSDYFDFTVSDYNAFSDVCYCVEEEFTEHLKETLYLDKDGHETKITECRLKDGKTWFEFEARAVYQENGVPTDKIICIKNITKFKVQNDELKYMAYYDSQTGLFNRYYFVMRLGEFLRKAEEEQCVVSILFMDMDDFKKINDGLGLIIGDEVVQQFGQFLSSFQSENVVVCHMNADVFCIAIYDPCGVQTVENIHKQIMDRTKKGFVLSNGSELYLTISAGVAEYPEASVSALELINCAEIVMFKAKSGVKGSIMYYNASILHDFLETVEIENKLKEAVFNSNFSLHFQPQYFTDSKKLRGVEALIRWKDGENKLISPAVFIPIAEKNGAIVPIGNWVMEESIRFYAEWKRKYGYPFILSINISAIQYRQKDFVKLLIATIQKYGVEPTEIELEITESILIEDFAEIKEKLVTLRDYGIRISLDDFGTGFSSLSYLNGLPIDTLKIDKSFVDRVILDESTRIITESIVTMVNKLGYESVAEGVETREQFAYMQKIGCDVIQGYLFGKPMPAEELEQLLITLL